jgi:hypothetical protein
MPRLAPVRSRVRRGWLVGEVAIELRSDRS